MSSLLRRNPTKIIPFILVSVLSAASACYAADPTLDGGHISSGAPTHGVVLHLHGCDGLVRSGVIGEWLSRLQQMGFKVYAPNSFGERRHPASCKPPFPDKSAIYSNFARKCSKGTVIGAGDSSSTWGMSCQLRAVLSEVKLFVGLK
jgi:hypothetical protein